MSSVAIHPSMTVITCSAFFPPFWTIRFFFKLSFGKRLIFLMIRTARTAPVADSKNQKTALVSQKTRLRPEHVETRRPGTNHRSKKMVKTPDLGKMSFWCSSYQFMAKIKKLAWKYRIQSLKIAKMKHFYIFFISEIRIVASSCLKNIWKVWQ